MHSHSIRLPWMRVLVACALAFSPPAFGHDLLVFAAASLKPALDELLAQPQASSIATIRVSYAASSQLARQIEHAAPADIFISADQDWMNYLAARELIVADSRWDLLGNSLSLIAPRDSVTTLTIGVGMNLRDALAKDGRLAIAEPSSVPAGKYAKAALIHFGVWDSVRDRVVAGDNVRAALNLVSRGEAALGIVYRSDTVDEPSIRVLGDFPASSHPPIRYPVAIVSGRDGVAARQLLSLLRTQASATLFRRHGFDAPPG